MLFFAVFVSILCIVSSEEKYTYSVTSTCDTVTDGICTKWTYSGSIKEDTQCFPEDSYIMTENGDIIQMKDLRIGDKILGYDSTNDEPIYTEVRAWFHRDRNTEMVYKSIITKESSLTVSDQHNIAIGTSDNKEKSITYSYELPENVKIDDDLVVFDNILKILQGSQIQDIYYKNARGLYAPFTVHSNYFVSDDAKHFYLVHSFANLKNPQKYEGYVHSIFDFAEFVAPSINQMKDDDETYLNPVADILARIWLGKKINNKIHRFSFGNINTNTTLTDFNLRGSSSNSNNNNNNENDDDTLEKLAIISTVLLQN